MMGKVGGTMMPCSGSRALPVDEMQWTKVNNSPEQWKGEGMKALPRDRS